MNKNKFIDSHIHLDDNQYDNDIEDVIKRAIETGIRYILNPSTDIDSIHKSKKISEQFEPVYFTAGIHPHDAKDFNTDIMDEIDTFVETDKFVGIGEVGLDFYRDHSPRNIQEKVFIKFIEKSLELKMPIIIHSRMSDKRMIDILQNYYEGNSLSGVWHCFSGDKKIAYRALDIGFLISFTGNITYKGSEEMIEVMQSIPDDRLLLETDGPYLAPIPNRGKRNEPSFVKLVYEFAAEKRKIDIDKMSENIYNNFITLFRIKE